MARPDVRPSVEYTHWATIAFNPPTEIVPFKQRATFKRQQEERFSQWVDEQGLADHVRKAPADQRSQDPTIVFLRTDVFCSGEAASRLPEFPDASVNVRRFPEPKPWSTQG